jgi:DNA-binding CsgD family transcriptional regulator
VERSRFPEELLDALAEVIPALVLGYYQVDLRVPTFTALTSPAGFYPEHLMLRSAELQDEHPVKHHHDRTLDPTAVRLSDVCDIAAFRKTPFYEEVNRPLGIEHQMTFRLAGPEPVLIAISLSRSDRDFTDAERDLCNLLREPLAAANALAVRTGVVHDSLLHYLHVDPSAALVSWEGDVMTPLDPLAEQSLPRFLNATGIAGATPADWLQAARSGDTALDGRLPERHTMVFTDTHGSVEVRHIPGVGDHHDLLTLRDLDRDLRESLRSLRLRPREAEVLEMIMDGRTNQEIATAMGITAATVKKHLERIYSTLGVSSRTAASAAARRASGIH